MVIIWLMMVNNIWLVVEPYPSEKYDFVSWDDDIPNIMESHTIPWFQITNQNTLITIKKRYSLILYHWMNPTLDDPILNGNPRNIQRGWLLKNASSVPWVKVNKIRVPGDS